MMMITKFIFFFILIEFIYLLFKLGWAKEHNHDHIGLLTLFLDELIDFHSLF